MWLRLIKKLPGRTVFLLHEGRARSIEQAIMLHGGEAQQSKNNFENLSAVDKVNIIKFLESL
jgi:CxxC motif-containing protein (DUF1111 family)